MNTQNIAFIHFMSYIHCQPLKMAIVKCLVCFSRCKWGNCKEYIQIDPHFAVQSEPNHKKTSNLESTLWSLSINSTGNTCYRNVLVASLVPPFGHCNVHQHSFDTKANHQTSNISDTLVGNKIADHSDVVGASPVGAAPITSSFST